MEVFRITLLSRASTLSASGHEGRWNSSGHEVIYACSSRSLACLENIVHRGSRGLHADYGVMVIFIPDKLRVEHINAHDLPVGWHNPPPTGYIQCQQIGDKWYLENKSPVLRIPNAIVKMEHNYIINTKHPDFKDIKLIATEPFFFDPRI